MKQDTTNAFQPTDSWRGSQPYWENTLVSVRAELFGKDAEAAMNRFLKQLTKDEEDSSRPTYYRGGYSVGVVQQTDASGALVLSSAGEDGIESVITAAQDLEEACDGAESSDVAVSWTELPAREVR